MKATIRLSVVTLIAVFLILGVSTVWAAGEDPGSAVLLNVGTTEICTAQMTLQPGTSMWIKVPYAAGKDVEIYAKGTASLDFGVYFGDQNGVPGFPSLGNPVGRLTPNSNEPGFLASWRGHIGNGTVSGFIYVLVKNNSTYPVTFSLCTISNDQFFPPLYTPVEPPPCIIPPTASLLAPDAKVYCCPAGRFACFN